MLEPALGELADACGIEPGYHDIWGVWREASDGTVRALLAAMGVEPGTAPLDATASALPPAVVVRRSELGRGIAVKLPAMRASRSLGWRIAEEHGNLHEGQAAIKRSSPLLSVPSLPTGYHRLELFDDRGPIAATRLIVAPDRCYLPAAAANGRRLWGVTLQLYGLRSARNWGIGDFTDLAEAAEQWADRGAAFIGTNPLHALYLGNPAHASPYSPSSRLLLNPLYLDVEAIDEFTECAAARQLAASSGMAAAIRTAREQEMVDYPAIASMKQRILELLHDEFMARPNLAGDMRRAAFEKFCGEGGEALRQYALYETLYEHFHRRDASVGSWQQWPEAYHDPASFEVARFARENAGRVGYFLYLQWQAALQLGAVKQRCRKSGLDIGLYLDLAVSIDRGGADAWSHQDLYALRASVGAPPDDFNRDGQDWGLPPYNPPALQRTGYGLFIATLRANMAAAGALRIDHVMGLARLFWVPPEGGAAAGAYVRYPLEDLLAIVALESVRNRCMVIGEDLGTVPVQLRHALREWGVLSYRLVMFERDSAGRFPAPADYPVHSMVAFATHDLPTFVGYWHAQQPATRRALLAALRAAGLAPAGVGDSPDLPPKALAQLSHAVHLYIARSPAMVVAVQLDDVTGSAAQANVPGTSDEPPNWRRKLGATLEEMRGDARLKRMGDELSAARAANSKPVS